MTIEHRRPLIAFIGVTLLCAFVTVNGFLLVARSPMGSDLAGARGLFSGFEGAEQPQLMPEVVGGATVVGESGAEAPARTTTEAQVPAIEAIRDAARTAAPAVDGAGDGAGTAAMRTAVAVATGTGPSREARPPRTRQDRNVTTGVRGRAGDTRGRSNDKNNSNDGGAVDDRADQPVVSRPAPVPTDTEPGTADKPGHGAKPPKPAKSAQPAKSHSGPGTKGSSAGAGDGSPGHSSHGTPPGHAKHDKAPKPAKEPKAPKPAKESKPAKDKPSSPGKSQGKSKDTSPSKSQGKKPSKSPGKSQGKAKGQGHK